MNREQAIPKLKEIFSLNFNIDNEFKEENYNQLLTRYFAFSAIDITYLYVLIEKKFNIKINRKLLTTYKLNSINSIIDVILESTV
ncbi:MAG: peptide maturation system acyl carrier-related protein [Anaerocolumna sp.]|jgi:acyl carrier protein|nr:peptide maturation system acyl carrier-related protein [Anaerocolumna sp.]